MHYPEFTHLSSIQNPRIKELVLLRDKRTRDKTDQFLIEGYREILRANDAHFPIAELYVCSELFLGINEDELIKKLKANKVRIYTCAPSVFQKISYRDRPDGLLAVAPQRHLSSHHLDEITRKKKSPLFVIAEAIEKPGNLGTILRSSDASGVDGLIICDQCTDIFNPNVVRASVGTLFTVPVAEMTSCDALAWLKSHKIPILAATPHAEKEFTKVDMKGPLAIAVGTEQLGLSKQWMQEADIRVKIPMYGVADSLNVAMATTLLLYEAIRQRNE